MSDATPACSRPIYQDLDFLRQLAMEWDAEEEYWVALGFLPPNEPLVGTTKQLEAARAQRDRQIETLRERPRVMRRNRAWLLSPVGSFELLSLPPGGPGNAGLCQGPLTVRPAALSPEREHFLRAIDEFERGLRNLSREGPVFSPRPAMDRLWAGPEAWAVHSGPWHAMLERALVPLLEKVGRLATHGELYSLGIWQPGEGALPGGHDLRQRFADGPPPVNPLPLRNKLLEELENDDVLKATVDRLGRRAFGSAGGTGWWRNNPTTLAATEPQPTPVEGASRLPRSLNVATERVDGLYETLARLPSKAARNGRRWAWRVEQQPHNAGTPATWWGFVKREASGLMADYIARLQARPGSLEHEPAAANDGPGRSTLERSVAAALSKLSREQGRVLLLRVLGGPGGKLTIDEVALVLKTTTHHVRRLESEAKAILARQIGRALEGWDVDTDRRDTNR
jgi:hypothetical protein